MSTTRTSPDLDIVFEALSSKHRREIIRLLGLQPHAISQLATILELSLPAIHKHITVLEDANMVLRKKAGRTHFLTLNTTPLRNLQEWVMQYHPYWGTNRETLENYIQYLDQNKKGGGNK